MGTKAVAVTPARRTVQDGELCVRNDHRALTADEQTRFLNAFTQVNAMNALGPLWTSTILPARSRGCTTRGPWMHHAEIDRLWSVWQASHAGQNPPLAGAAAVMDPWSETEIDTRDITALGYTYV